MNSIALVVVEPFRQYKRGDQIEDAATVAEILASEHQNHVVKTTVSTQAAAAAQE